MRPENYENHENPRTQFENHENHENHRIPWENHENHENLISPTENNENQKFIKFQSRIKKTKTNYRIKKKNHKKSWN